MKKKGFTWLFWGFLFVMLSFNINNFDILPDIVGYIFFAIGISKLSNESSYFLKAGKYNIVLIILSIPRIFNSSIPLTNFTFTSSALIAIILFIVSIIFNLLTIYNLFQGIQEMARQKGNSSLELEADDKWKQYLFLQIGFALTFIFIFIPLLGLAYFVIIFIAAIVVAIRTMLFMSKCSYELN
ncbi:hypothetical protein [Clostridium fungisolvens]|uniref:DUF308 domain-containing protein n=1 Tax=Clostridium fungisolvens TaxID=1604897 RepID=A0A6V8SLN5_9CLOT|nr:hypothetical protein [Clostridium fungisolvens]GFP76088.1 hypothetical protein bsdtw1_02184 [Clostridium fungisolvens]